MARRRILTEREQHQSLVKKYEDIKNKHGEALQKRAARVVTSASVMRVFKKDTKDDLRRVLVHVRIDDLPKNNSHNVFKKWFKKELERVARAVKKKNHRNSRIRPGWKWGHCTKVLALYVRELVLNSRYFKNKDVKKIERMLYVPIDSININKMKELGCPPLFDNIKQIDTSAKFYKVQDTLKKAADEVNVPRVWFDDNWGDRQ